MVVKNNDKTELWSKGRSREGMLGQGNDKTESIEFAPLDYDKDNITFTKVQLFLTLLLLSLIKVNYMDGDTMKIDS